VVGTTGSGKSTMAGRLAERLSIPHVELDAIYWGPNWQSRPFEELRTAVMEATQGDA
jgi:adenylate kinase family enzyme